MSLRENENYENPDKTANGEGQHHDYPPAKRRRLVGDTEHGFANNHRAAAASKQLTHEDYTVGWICALPLEMTAARTMLDEEHISLPNPPQDQNAYILGEICGHAVVITCLPSGVYGNNSAAVVATHLMSTFKSISIPLLVGIGGGVPRLGRDIRLGDVVVGTPSSDYPAVVQYDFGKTVANGVFEHKGSLNKPKMSLLNALSSLRSTHQLKGSQISMFITKAFEEHNLSDIEFGSPVPESDIFFETECDHVPEDSVCPDCGPLKPIIRVPRQSTGPVIHYGTIASGNQVIKHAKTRDFLAQQHGGVLCFEMEAAGLMDSLSCLVIRGICDYCDTKKNKQFQGYAALASAAYAKEFLLSLPKSEFSLQTSAPTQSNVKKMQHRQQLMEALNFDEADSRRATVSKAHSQTCKWLLEQQEYRDWADPDKFHKHNGLLWIKGKAGSGKSTLMKFVLEETLRSKPQNCLVISFFFNARGQDLEKSTIGMYRSLVYQLLDQLPELQIVLDELSVSTNFDHDKLQFLRNAFEYVLKNLGSKSLVCFVDALDECPEEQIRNMVEFFTNLGRIAVTDMISFCVCFTSRYYPSISVDIGQQLDLEKQHGHSNDIVLYVKSELKIGKNKRHESLKAEIAQKSNGIFLWVVLVVQILKREYDRGMVHQMSERIKMIPQELDELFRDILTRDNNDLPGLVLCMQWILYSKRQLKCEEFYFALRSGYEDFDGEPWDAEEIPAQIMNNFILTCSKGLAELTRGRGPVVQFIHESVRQFLSKPDALLNLWHGFQGLSEDHGHERLKECCYRQVLACNAESLGLDSELPNAKDPAAVELREAACRNFPFLDYAINHVMYHAGLAKAPQIDFLLNFSISRWLNLYNLLQKVQSHRIPRTPEISHVLTHLDLPDLLGQFWSIRPLDRESLRRLVQAKIEVRNIRACRTMLLAYYFRDRTCDPARFEHIDAILELIDSILCAYPTGFSKLCFRLLHLLIDWHEVKNTTELNEMLQYAIESKREAALRLSLEAGALLNQLCPEGIHQSALSLLVSKYQLYFNRGRDGRIKRKTTRNSFVRDTDTMSEIISCMSLLLAKGISFNDPDGEKPSPLANATEWADISVLQFLLDHGARLSPGEKPLYEAVIHSNVRATIFWLGNGLNLIMQDEKRDTILHDADVSQMAQILAEHTSSMYGVVRKNGHTPLHIAALKTWHEPIPIFELLSRQFANLNDKDKKERTPLHLAVESTEARVEVVLALLHSGAETNCLDYIGRSPLHYAAYRSTTEIAELLLNYKADANCRDEYGQTPLHSAVESTEANVEVVLALLHNGAEINCLNYSGRSPLHYAVHGSTTEIAELLLNYKADANCRDRYGQTPLHLAVKGTDASVEVVLALLRNGAETNLFDYCSWSPLHYAAYRSTAEIVGLLLNYKATANHQNDQGQTPLHLAVKECRAEIVGTLLRHGAIPNFQDDQGRTALHLAIMSKEPNLEMVNTLLHYGAGPE